MIIKNALAGTGLSPLPAKAPSHARRTTTIRLIAPLETDSVPLTQTCGYCGDSNLWHENDTGKCISEGCACKQFIKQCQFYLTIPAERLESKDRLCIKEATTNIAGVHEGRLVDLNFCEEHYQIVSKFLDEPEK